VRVGLADPDVDRFCSAVTGLLGGVPVSDALPDVQAAVEHLRRTTFPVRTDARLVGGCLFDVIEKAERCRRRPGSAAGSGTGAPETGGLGTGGLGMSAVMLVPSRTARSGRQAMLQPRRPRSTWP
jgi:hypothetical protein